ncbi:MAG TPA: NAD-dependent epimerase/dehydratase family protein [Gemmatimonadota bacterium]|nr:NAD-dependent epimerase/dehydratase family protein [Gemmatimonadota bacterium]
MSSPTNERVLVTGATGFIGGRLARSLVDDGHRVRALVRRGTDPSRLPAMELVVGDLVEPGSLEAAAEGCAVVYHVAAVTSSRSGSNRELEDVNVQGSANIAAAAARAGARRFVHVSSCGVYGYRNRFPANESTPLHPDTPYRISKARAERVVFEIASKTRLPVVVARLASIYGPGASNWLRFCRSIRANRFRMIGDGRNPVHLGHVLDIVDGLRRCADTPGIEGRCYNLAGAEPVAIGDLVATFAQALGVRTTRRSWPAFPFRVTRHVDLALCRYLGMKIQRLHSYDLFLSGRSFDIARARRELGFRPRISAAEGLTALVEGYFENGSIDSREGAR